MNKVPAFVTDAKVICYAFINTSFQRVFLKRKIKALAICQYAGESCFYLFGCDELWQSVTDTWHQNIEDAKKQADSEYETATLVWGNAP